MSQVFAAFGIDWRLLLVNIVNFGVLLWALWYFLYEPLTKMMEVRRQKVIEGVEKAEAAVRRLSEIEGTRSEILAQAATEGDTVLARARQAGTQKQHELVAAGEAAAERLRQEAEAQAAELKSQAMQESKHELAKLVVLGVEKMLAEGKK